MGVWYMVVVRGRSVTKLLSVSKSSSSDQVLFLTMILYLSSPQPMQNLAREIFSVWHFGQISGNRLLPHEMQ